MRNRAAPTRASSRVSPLPRYRPAGTASGAARLAIARRRSPIRWDTEFGRWVARYGVMRIVREFAKDPDLRITDQAVYGWLRGYAPRPARAAALVRLSRGTLTLEAIYRHAADVRAGVRSSSRAR